MDDLLLQRRGRKRPLVNVQKIGDQLGRGILAKKLLVTFVNTTVKADYLGTRSRMGVSG